MYEQVNRFLNGSLRFLELHLYLQIDTVMTSKINVFMGHSKTYVYNSFCEIWLNLIRIILFVKWLYYFNITDRNKQYFLL